MNGIKLSDDAHHGIQDVAQHWIFVFYFTVKKKARATHEKLSVLPIAENRQCARCNISTARPI
jgi:hypothetical protein